MSKGRRKPRRASKGSRETEKLSLHPLSLEEALKRAMETGRPSRKIKKKAKKSSHALKNQRKS